MKKTLVMILAILCSQANAGGISFKCNGYSFTVHDDKTPLSYSMMAGDKIERSPYTSKVTRIGNIPIEYSPYTEKVASIGNVRIEYSSYTGKIEAIGGLRIQYNAYSGEMTGSSGSIGCNW